MTLDFDLQDQSYTYFLMEAPDLLRQIEEDLQELAEDPSVKRVHSLMRSAHTLKGAAASVGNDTIRTVAHSLEDTFRVLYQPDLVLDTTAESLLYQAVDCLRVAVSAAVSHQTLDEAELLQHSQAVFDQLSFQLGSSEEYETALPTSAELGFDIVQSIFETGVEERLSALAEDIAAVETQNSSVAELRRILQSQCEVMIGLAESLNLPGLQAISEAVLQNLETRPEEVMTVAKAALANFRAAQSDVLAGDRTVGGTVLPELRMAEPAQERTLLDEVWGNTEISSDPSLEAVWGVHDSEVWESSNGSEVLNLELESESQPTEEPEPEFLDLGFEDQGLTTLWNDSIALSSPTGDELLDSSCVDLVRQLLSHLHRLQDGSLSLAELDQTSIIKSLELLEQLARPLGLSRLSVILQSLLEGLNSDFSQAGVIAQLALADLQSHRSADLSGSEPGWDPQDLFLTQWLTQTSSPLVSDPIVSDPNAEVTLLDEVWDVPAVRDLDLEEVEVTEKTQPLTVNQDPLEDSPSVAVESVVDHESLEANNMSILGSLSASDLAALKPYLKIEVAANPLETRPLTKQPAKPTQDLVRVEVEKLDRLHHQLGDLLTTQNHQVDQHQTLHQAAKELRQRLEKFRQQLYELWDWAEQSPSALSAATATVTNGSSALKALRFAFSQTAFEDIELDQYSEWQLMIQSLLDDSVILNELADVISSHSQQANLTVEKQRRILSQTRDTLMAARLIPLADLFGRFEQMIQQLRAAYQKQVTLSFQGSDVLVDKSIVEKLYNPLLHLLRNAFDHGIEEPKDRRSQGKSEQAMIQVRAQQHGNRLLLEVQDDGRGIDYDGIRAKAVQRGLYSEEQTGRMSSRELLDVIFEPGFSTKSSVSDLSGRGVGLDVVRSQLQELKGSIRISSMPRRGTTFSLEIPLSLTITKLLLCQDQHRSFAFLSDNIVQMVFPKSDDISWQQGRRLFHWQRGQKEQLLAVQSLSDLVTYSYPWSQPKSSAPLIKPLVILQSDDDYLALEVDQLLGEQELVIKNLDPLFPVPPFVCGCSPLGDGRMALVLDGYELLNQMLYGYAQGSSSTQSMETKTVALGTGESSGSLSVSVLKSNDANTSRQTVMVVEDSLTVRQTLVQTLQHMGYEVLSAAHGQQAVEILTKQSQDQADVQLILCDIEMPYMNGYEFLNYRHQNSDLASIPVVMLTSRSSQKHKQLAMELGASAYLTKPFQQQELLSTLETVLS